MRVLVMGAGAVGGYFGSMMQMAGEEVVMVARGAHLEAMRKNGLTVISHDDEIHLEVNATDRPSSSGEFDLILVTVKSYDTEKAADLISKNVGSSTLLLSLQNGVENDELLARRFGWEKILGGVAYIGASVIKPGVIKHFSGGKISLGEYPHGARGAALIADRFRQRIDISISNNILEEKWRKLLFNAGFNTVTALTGLSFRSAADCRETREVINGIITEGIKVARAEGVFIPDAAVEGMFDLARSLGEAPSSMLTDLRSGRKLELYAILGVIIRKGECLGIPTTVSRTVYSLLKHKDRTLK